jgi:hypothetical protein
MLRQRLPDKSFSDRLSYDEAELDRANEYLLRQPLAYQPDPERSRALWQAVAAYCAKIGWDIRDPDTWNARQRKPLRQTHALMALTAALALDQRCTEQEARALLERIADHVERKNELAYSLMRQFLGEAGIPATNTRAARVFRLLARAGFMAKRFNYYHDPACGYAHGNFFVLDAGLCEAGGKKEEEKEVSTTSLPGCFPDPDDQAKLLAELRRIECDRRFAQRLRQLQQQKWAA